MPKDRRVFKASVVEYGRAGWIADLSPDNVVNPVCYWRFRTRKQAREFLRLYDAGINPREAEYIVIGV